MYHNGTTLKSNLLLFFEIFNSDLYLFLFYNRVITNMNFRRQLLTYTPEMLSDKINKKVLADYVNTPNWNIEKIHKASIAAGAFSEWVEVMAK